MSRQPAEHRCAALARVDRLPYSGLRDTRTDLGDPLAGLLVAGTQPKSCTLSRFSEEVTLDGALDRRFAARLPVARGASW